MSHRTKSNKISFDTKIITGIAETISRKEKMPKKQILSGRVVIVSSIVKDQSIRKLMQNIEVEERVSRALINKTLNWLDAKIIQHKNDDIEKGKQIRKKYKNSIDKIDASIIYHLKREKVSLVITTDHKFKNVAQREGLNVLLLCSLSDF